MTVKSVEKVNKQTSTGKKELLLDAKETDNKEYGKNSYKADSVCQKNKDLRAKIKKAIEANDLCYNYETGFHYMKQ